ncbi:MAG TPA: ABC-type transport auxiliary lipoprotein family protein [Caulobacteraceae bacterium]|nr:ABC-type transport auxiliary lipoprotein family protein [Caulobacteraceae bacterium]
MRRLTTILAALALAAPLGACALLGGGKPANLYRFGVEPAQAVQSSAARFGVLKTPIDFVEAAASDRILTMTGGSMAYIKDSRWVSPAEVLFDEAVDRTFQNEGGRARLLQRGEVAKADYVLKLDVRTFETRYAYEGAVPEVVVEVRALLSRNDDRAVVGERVFTSTVPASDNRVSAISAAYDRAVSDVLGQLHGWVNSTPG